MTGTIRSIAGRKRGLMVQNSASRLIRPVHRRVRRSENSDYRSFGGGSYMQRTGIVTNKHLGQRNQSGRLVNVSFTGGIDDSVAIIGPQFADNLRPQGTIRRPTDQDNIHFSARQDKGN